MDPKEFKKTMQAYYTPVDARAFWSQALGGGGAEEKAAQADGALPPGFDGFAPDEITPPAEGARRADEELKVGAQFRVGRFGPVWQVVKAHGMTGYVQRSDHKRKWFGYSHNRDTGEVVIYPVKQGSGDRIGDPVAFGPLALVEGGP
jgi:hypothetical protein